MVSPSPVPWPRSAAPVTKRCGPSRSTCPGSRVRGRGPSRGPRDRHLHHLHRIAAVPAGVGQEVDENALQSAGVGASSSPGALSPVPSSTPSWMPSARGRVAPAANPARRRMPSVSSPSGWTSRSGRSAFASSRATSRRSSVRRHRAATRSRTSSVGRPSGSSPAAVCRPVRRSAQLVRHVGGEPLLRLDALLERGGHGVHGRRQLGHLAPGGARRGRHGDPGVQLAPADPAGGRRRRRRSRLSRLASPTPPSAASPTTTAPDATSSRSSAATSSRSASSGSRTERTCEPTGRAAHTTGRRSSRSRYVLRLPDGAEARRAAGSRGESRAAPLSAGSTRPVSSSS